MNNQEFIEKLSPKAKQIINNYEYKNPHKNHIIVQISHNRSQVNVGYQDRYLIEVRYQPIFSKMEYEFLHEFFHCIQYDEGFPHIISITSRYNKMASAISSAILDLDVHDRLINNGYMYDSTLLKKSIDTIRKSIIISFHDKAIKQEINEINQFIFICCKIAFIRINYKNQNEINQLLNVINRYAPNIGKAQSAIYNAIYKTGYDTPAKVYKVFKQIIRELKLSNFVKIN